MLAEIKRFLIFGLPYMLVSYLVYSSFLREPFVDFASNLFYYRSNFSVGPILFVFFMLMSSLLNLKYKIASSTAYFMMGFLTTEILVRLGVVWIFNETSSLLDAVYLAVSIAIIVGIGFYMHRKTAHFPLGIYPQLSILGSSISAILVALHLAESLR